MIPCESSSDLRDFKVEREDFSELDIWMSKEGDERRFWEFGSGVRKEVWLLLEES